MSYYKPCPPFSLEGEKFDSQKEIGFITGLFKIESEITNASSYYFYPDNGNPLIATFLFHPENEIQYKEALEEIVNSFEFIPDLKSGGAGEIELRDRLREIKEEALRRKEKNFNTFFNKVQNIRSLKIKYNIIFILIALAITLFFVLIGAPVWAGLLVFISSYWLLRKRFLNKWLINKIFNGKDK